MSIQVLFCQFGAMNKYKKIMKPKEVIVKDEEEIRVTAAGSVSAYVSRAAKLFSELEKTYVVIAATGNALTKAVTSAEVIKRRFKGLHQVTKLGSQEIIDEYEPLEEGLDKVSETRNVPFVEIKLSKEPLDIADKGYQPPIDESEVKEYDPEEMMSRGRGKGRKGKGNGKGKGKVSDDDDDEDEAPTGKGKGKSKSKGKSKGKGKGKDADEPDVKGKSKGKAKGKVAEVSPKGKGKEKGKDKGKGKGKGKKSEWVDEWAPPKSKGKGKKVWDEYESYPKGGKSKGKGTMGKGKSSWDDWGWGAGDYNWMGADDYSYGGKSKGKSKGKAKGKGKGYW